MRGHLEGSGLRKGILLAGGNGSRLAPLTVPASKQLLPVFDKPMIYYPLCTLMELGVRDILIVATPQDLERFRTLLGDGSKLGVRFSFVAQQQPRGIAEALVIGRDFLGDHPSVLILGDNLFYGLDHQALAGTRTDRALVVGYQVANPASYGVLEFDDRSRPAGIVEKPSNPPSSFAVPGLYLYPPRAWEEASRLLPSPRGELEITDLNNRYFSRQLMDVQLVLSEAAWLDMGTADSLLEAGQFIRTLQQRLGTLVGSPEETAVRLGLITRDAMLDEVRPKQGSTYYASLMKLGAGQTPIS